MKKWPGQLQQLIETSPSRRSGGRLISDVRLNSSIARHPLQRVSACRTRFYWFDPPIKSRNCITGAFCGLPSPSTSLNPDTVRDGALLHPQPRATARAASRRATADRGPPKIDVDTMGIILVRVREAATPYINRTDFTFLCADGWRGSPTPSTSSRCHFLSRTFRSNSINLWKLENSEVGK